MDNRYQFQSLPVKLYRRVRFLPSFVWHLLLDILLWLVFGAKKLETIMSFEDKTVLDKMPKKIREKMYGRMAAFKSIIMQNRSMYAYHRKHVYTTKELIERIRNGGN